MAANDIINSRLEYILDTYDRRLDTFHGIVGVLVLASIILLFFIFKIAYDYSLWKAILWTLISGICLLIAMSVISLIGVSMIVSSARENFNRDFPYHSPRRKIAVAALGSFSSNSKIVLELLASLPDYKSAYAGPTESSPDDQLEQALDQIQTESNESSVKFQAQQPPVKQPLSQSTIKQAINPYGRILLQPAKKIMMKTQEKAEKKKFIMLDPEKKNERI
jgi:hypothetical protein